MDADAESDLGPGPHETFTRLETVFRSIFKNVKTISLKVLRGMRSEMLVDTLLTFSTIQKNNIPMFCSIFYSLWPSEKLGGTHSGGGRGRRDSPVICGADRALSVVIVLMCLHHHSLCRQHGNRPYVQFSLQDFKSKELDSL